MKKIEGANVRKHDEKDTKIETALFVCIALSCEYTNFIPTIKKQYCL